MATIKQFNEILFGTNGTGKTTEMLNIFNSYMDGKESIGQEKNALFLMPDDSEKKYDGIPEIHINDIHGDFGIAKLICNVNFDKSDKKTKTIYELLYERYALAKRQFNGIVINDDMGGLMSRRPNDILTMLSRRRQMNMDLIWNFHGLTTDCPKAFFRTVTGIILFKTTDDHTDTMNKIGRDKHDMFKEAYFEVQAFANGRMLDINGNITSDPNKAYYNPTGIKLPYHKTEIRLIE